jgi:hypothetical protein
MGGDYPAEPVTAPMIARGIAKLFQLMTSQRIPKRNPATMFLLSLWC